MSESSFKVEGNNIVLPHGRIEMYLEMGSYLSSSKVTWDFTYERPELEYFRYKEFLTLEAALAYYDKCELNMKGA